MDLDWNVPLINGNATNPFFSYASYVKYSVPPETVATAGQKNHLQQKFSDSATEASSQLDFNLLAKEEPHEKSPGHQSTGSHATSATDRKIHNTGGGIGVCLNLKVPYPRPSVFTREEQRLYLELKRKFSDLAPNSTEDMKQLNFLNELHKRVVEEQEEYMKYLESVAHRCSDDYFFITPEALKFVEDFISCRRHTVLKYPRFYTTLDTVSLVPPRTNSSLNLCHNQKLLEMGTVPKVILPKIDFSRKRQKMALDSIKFAQCFPGKDESKISSSGKQPLVSEDPNAERLAIKYGAHIVISSSSLQCLIDNHAPQFPRQWEMPVIVKEHSLPEGVEKRRIVYVDKPFISKSLSNYDKNVLYHHLAFKTTVLHPSHISSYSLERNRTTDLNDSLETDDAVGDADRNLFDSVGADLEDLETFGTVSRRVVREDQTPLTKHSSCKNADRNSSQQSDLMEPSQERDAAAAAAVKSDVTVSLGSSNLGPTRNADESLSTDDDDVHLAIDLDRPLSPIVSTDGQFDKKEGTANGGSATRQSRRLAEKRRGQSTSSDGSSLALRRSMPVDPAHGDSGPSAEGQTSSSPGAGKSAEVEANGSLKRRSSIDRQLRYSVAAAEVDANASGCADSVCDADDLGGLSANGLSPCARSLDCIPTEVSAGGDQTTCQLGIPSPVTSSSVPGRMKRSVTLKNVSNSKALMSSADAKDEQCSMILPSTDASAEGQTPCQLQSSSSATPSARFSASMRRKRSVSSTLLKTTLNVKDAMTSPTDVDNERSCSAIPSADVAAGDQTCCQLLESSSTASLSAVTTRRRSVSLKNTSNATVGSSRRRRSSVEVQNNCELQVSSSCAASAVVPAKRRCSTSSISSKTTSNAKDLILSSVDANDELCLAELPSTDVPSEEQSSCPSRVVLPAASMRRNRSASSMNSSNAKALITPSADPNDAQRVPATREISAKTQLSAAEDQTSGRSELSSVTASTSVPAKRRRSVPLKSPSNSKTLMTPSATADDERCPVESQTVRQSQLSSTVTKSSVSNRRRRSVLLTTSKTASNAIAHVTSPAVADEQHCLTASPVVGAERQINSVEDQISSQLQVSFAVSTASVGEQNRRSVSSNSSIDCTIAAAVMTSSANASDVPCSEVLPSTLQSADVSIEGQLQVSTDAAGSSLEAKPSIPAKNSVNANGSTASSAAVVNQECLAVSRASMQLNSPPVSAKKNRSASIEDSSSHSEICASDAEAKDCSRFSSEMKERVSETEIKCDASSVDFTSHTAMTESVAVIGDERGRSPVTTETMREPKLHFVDEPKLSVQNPATSVCQTVSVSAGRSPAICPTDVRESRPAVTPSCGDVYSVGRRRVARIPLGSSRSMTPSASAPDSRSTALRATPSVDDGRPKQPVASAGDGRLAVSQAGPSIDDAWTKPSHGVSASSAAAAAAASQRSSPSVAIGNKVAGSSAAFQSPLDQILVDQRRMFERTATYNAATSRTPANVQQFSSHPMSQQKKLSPSDAVAQVTRAASPPPVQQPLLASASRPTVASSNVGPMSSAASAETPESIQSSDKTQALNSTPHASRSSTASGTSPTESDNSGHSEDQAVAGEDPSEYTRPQKSNVIYDLWTLGNLKILVRYSYHGVYSPSRRKQSFVHLMSKMEYQLQHGVEQLTYGEAVRSWLALLLRPNTRVIRARIDAAKSELAIIDEWDMIKFHKELSAFHPGVVVNVLNTVFERLVKLEPGCHLISHMPGSTHAQIKKVTKSQSGVYDLHLACHSAGEPHKPSAPQGIPWMPINTNFLLPYHKKFGRIPGTFEPKDSARINTVRSNTNLNLAKKNNKKKNKSSAR